MGQFADVCKTDDAARLKGANAFASSKLVLTSVREMIGAASFLELAFLMMMKLFIILLDSESFTLILLLIVPGAVGTGIAAVIRTKALKDRGACLLPDPGPIECRLGLHLALVAGAMRISMA
jgi:hypothetical protein